jgi:penicillin-binding protein 1C
MRITRSADDQFRVWVPLGQMSPSLVDVFLLKEDRSFYWNPGFNPTSLMRAALRTYRGGVRQGGSTITMQLARLMYHLNTRTPAGKLRQIAAALWLEARYSKSSILEAYLNLVPLGGNIQGVGAASQIYFEKSPGALTLGESLTFAVIPQRPARRSGFAASEPDLLRARTDLARRWLSRHGNSPDDARRVDLAILAHPQPMPRIAPHFVDGLLARGAGTDHRITTTIDSGLQRLVERQIHAYIEQYGDRGIRNAASLLVDTRDMSVKAWVGSADFGNDAIDGQVNGVLAKRSPGSTLKPFVYALALDQGILHPKTILRDLPTAFGPFTPENFDGRFFGPITAEAALIRSRNIPAVWVSSQLRQPTLYQFLQSAGVRDMKPESFYGLALPLGGGEITMEELAGLYAMLANQGMFRPLRLEHSTKSTAGLSLLSPEASFITFDMLRHNPRPDEDGSTPLRGRWPVAWKTGTSWGFRDAWSAGVVGPYVLVLWIGDFHGDGNPAFVGVDAAAPLFFRIADALNLARPDEAVPPLTPPPGVAKVPVCAASGELPNAYCPQVVDSWYIPGKSPIHVSQLHRVVALDRISGKPVCPPYPADTRFEVFEFWPSDMLKLFRQAGLPHRIPPPLPACTNTDPTDVPRIASPMRNVSYTIRHSARGEDIALDAQAAADVRTLFWFDGNALIGMRPVSDGALPWRPPNSGAHLIRVVDDHGRSAERDVDVRIQP